MGSFVLAVAYVLAREYSSFLFVRTLAFGTVAGGSFRVKGLAMLGAENVLGT